MIRPKSHTKASLVLTGLILPFIFSATRENACSLAVLATLG
jgi:hypothetical protein